jgi:hypothetical protein
VLLQYHLLANLVLARTEKKRGKRRKLMSSQIYKFSAAVAAKKEDKTPTG